MYHLTMYITDAERIVADAHGLPRLPTYPFNYMSAFGIILTSLSRLAAPDD